ncbi:MAG: SCO family protein [Chitinophagaceae bacterium]|nr:SCO family protein [Chitinophagaceae bacterium]
MKKILIPVIALLLCFTVIWRWTLGFSAFTIFSYTLEKAGEMPRTMPDIRLMNQQEQVFHLKDKQKFVLINFVYLNCPYVCHKVNNQIEQIYHRFNRSVVPSKLEFVTISFDLKNDDVEKIKRYRDHFGEDIEGWNFALPYQSSQESFDQFLHAIGIWKYTVPSSGIINHSVYLLLISPDNKIVKVFDPARDSENTIVEEIFTCLKE